ncbi:universal stress protein [Dactylosporangium sp. NBC_01737]|uniref:universal stress protein n=1 Tax=Dactylosporangium sp. NBC_01737 TaxID=2975959 RepID=UPI002E133ADF|nr:universal stress protein [Dactylosporangium sp. NBC_01737]
MDAQRIVVGYDGSIGARDAVGWAAAEAERTGSRLHIVYAYLLAWPGAEYDGPVAQMTAEAQERGDRLVAEIVEQVRRRGTGIQVVGTALHAAPAPALIDLGDTGAGLIVVGNRGGGGITNLLVGSVSQQVATHAHAPVVVVRGRHDAVDGPVVAGADGSASSHAALGIAFETARLRGTGVLAVRAYVPPAVTALPAGVIEASERRALDASVTGWKEKYPSVKVETLLVNGRTAEVLVGASRTAQLIVVGSRGHGGFTGLLLGSVGQQLMHHAECPVLIVHAPKPS